ncbi:caspase family protein [Bradyrhizobium sp. AZCC 2289]|uniref:caspase family protein n=1 Tax=Bradyrhizobium sp. AZCC 2289 TaxID=3117026 RepID=UPI002FF0534C
MRRLTALVVAVLALCFASQSALAEKRVALVIGNSNYQNVAALTNPANDATAIAETLRKASFDVVESRRDLKYMEMRRALRDFTDKARGADIAVIYFAGHGLEVDGVNYVVPVDATLERDADVDDEAIALNRILFAAEPATKLRLIILDACRDNPFAKKMKRTIASRSLGRGLVGVEANRPNTFIAFAAKEGSTAADGDGTNSPFSAALVKHLTRPGLDIRKAFGFVRDDVMNATGNQQEPYTTNSLGGNDVALVPAPAAAGNANTDVRRDYELAERVGTREAWDSFVAAHPSGFYTDLAKAQRNKLAAEAERSTATESAKRPEETSTAPAEPPKEDQPAAAKPANPVVASRSPSEVKPEQPVAQDIPRLLQAELKRVGCKTGDIDGEWNGSARRALSAFNDSAGTKFDVKLASIDALDAVRARIGRVCPLDCERGYRASGDRCVKITCDEGFVPGANGSCQKRPERAPRVTERAHHAPAGPKRGGGKCFVYNGTSFCE